MAYLTSNLLARFDHSSLGKFAGKFDVTNRFVGMVEGLSIQRKPLMVLEVAV